MFIAGDWVAGNAELPVENPFTGEILDTVPAATATDVEAALAAAQAGAVEMARTTGFDRSAVLCRAADILDTRAEELSVLISAEEGKPLVESRAEVERTPALLRLAAFEGTQIRGETLPLDSAANGTGKLGLTLRVPCGVVVAITPYNFPLLLVLHKIAPALAAGNAVILKPATQTPLAALKLTEILVEAGLPPLAIQCVTGSGSTIGPQLCADRRVRKISFTGSTEVGLAISRVAGVKKLSLELGSNAPAVVLADADLAKAADALAVGGYLNAGQVCISVQRVLVDRRIHTDLLDALRVRVGSIVTGDPMEERTRLSAMISADEAKRVERIIAEATAAGARVVAGGDRDGALIQATVVADVKPSMRLAREEVFGPVVAVTAVRDVDEALAVANDSHYGLASGIFTRDLHTALRFAKEAEQGNIHINSSPLWRADLMPYGGLKQSGFGKEGPRYAVEEMTETKTVVFH